MLEMLEKAPEFERITRCRHKSSPASSQRSSAFEVVDRIGSRHRASEEERKRLSNPPTLAQRQAAKKAAEAERKRLLTTRK